MKTKFLLRSLAAILFLSALASLRADSIFTYGSTWKYFIGTQEASSPVEAWRAPGFNDSTWLSGPGAIGYPSSPPGVFEATIQTTLPTSTVSNYLCVFFRRQFVISNPAAVGQLNLTLRIDDGYAAWINGTLVGSNNVPSTLAFNATPTVPAATEDVELALTVSPSVLVAGTNIIALQVFQAATTSSDLVMDVAMTSDVDAQPPFVVSVVPSVNSTVTALTFIDVTFDDNVTGVNASDLLINGAPAASMTTVNPREYVFNFTQPPTGTVSVAWASGHGITDLAAVPNPFAGGSWTYTFNPNAGATTLIISEFLADNLHGLEDEDGTRSDWIEVYNPGPSDANLGGWFLTDSATNLTQWRFPSLNLGANKYLLVWASSKNKTNAAAALHTNFRLSQDAGSYLALVGPNTNVVSVFNGYPEQQSDISYGRDRVDPNIVGYFITPTPGAQNATSGPGFAADPILSLESGVYTNNSLTMTISVAPGTIVRYTVNSYLPTNTSTIYTGPITFSTNATIKVRAYSTNNVALWPGRILARTFVFLDSTTRDFNSNIPLIIISTEGRPLDPQAMNIAPGSPRTNGSMVVIDTYRGRSSLQGTPDFIGLAQYEITGQTSAGFAKKPHRVEIEDAYGNDRAVSLLGLPAEADWILRNPWSDKCLMNDFLGYELWDDMGHYSCRRRFVEVFVDTGGGKLTYPADYYGVMVLFERIEVDKHRVNIAELTPSNTNEPAISGGYMFKKDKDSAGDLNFSTIGGNGFPAEALKIHAPKPRDITTPQLNWLRNYLNLMETAMYSANWTNATGTNHYSYYMNVDAFVDQQLHVEFTKQIDGYRLSDFFSKDRNGKVQPDPIWDWNLSFGNGNYLQGGKTNGWYWNIAGEGMTANEHIWLRRLVNGNAAASGNPNVAPGDPDFRQKMTDRWNVLRTNVLNGDRVSARIDELATLLTESAARNYQKYQILSPSVSTWPNPGGPPTWDVDYVNPTTYVGIITQMKKWTKGRYVWLDNQFLGSPSVNQMPGPISPGINVQLSAPVATIYYTLDGSDPRLSGGGISPGALLYNSGTGITLNSNALLFARAYSAATNYWTPWSGPSIGTYYTQIPHLVVSEIMYHPAPPASGTNADDFEYIEVKNAGGNSLNLAGYSISGGVDFTFPSITLNPGQRTVVVANQPAFSSRYPGVANVAGQYLGNLGDDGDHIILRGRYLEPILDFHYEDTWYPITDGFGFSLVAVDDNAPAAAWSTNTQWRASGTLYGTPGVGETTTLSFGRVVINEALTHSDTPPPTDTIELRNLESTNVNIGGWYLTDDFRTPKKFRILPGTIINGNSYLTFTESDFNVTNTSNIPFALSSQGDELYIFSADAGGNLSGYVHGFSYGAQRNGVTFGRVVISTGEERFVAQKSNSLGQANSGPLVGPIAITEINYHPPDVNNQYGSFDNNEDEYIELHNISGSSVALSSGTNSWHLRNAVDYDFPLGSSIPANGFALVVSIDPSDPAALAAFKARNLVPESTQIFGPYSGQLDNSSDDVELAYPDAPALDGSVPYVLADKVKYFDTAPWAAGADGLGPALQRVNESAYGNDPANWVAGGRSPGFSYVPGSPPVITQQPVNTSGIRGLSAMFSITATGPGPLSYQWRHDSGTGPRPVTGANSSVLTLQNLQTSDAGVYDCVVLNPPGSVVSDPATLSVLIPATILTQPQSITLRGSTNAVDYGNTTNNATFNVLASGSGSVSYQWRSNGVNLAGATGTSYGINNVQLIHEATYDALITDAVGTIPSAQAKLTVLLSPNFLQLPLAQFVPAGSVVTLSAEVSGNPLPMTFDWRRGSTTLASNIVNRRTDFFTFTATNAPNVTNQYRLVLKNAANAAPGNASAFINVITVADTDGDGIPDSVETSLGLNPNDPADAAGDKDGDGMSNRDEYLAGTDPSDPASYLRVDLTSMPGIANVQFGAVSNRTYSVQYSDSVPNATAWTKLGDVVARSTNRVEKLQDANVISNRFYRIVVPSQP